MNHEQIAVDSRAADRSSAATRIAHRRSAEGGFSTPSF
jgi:hypothetical protein